MSWYYSMESRNGFLIRTRPSPALAGWALTGLPGLPGRDNDSTNTRAARIQTGSVLGALQTHAARADSLASAARNGQKY
jgi:hypothetical protein